MTVKAHPDIRKLNREGPPPKGCRHLAYSVTRNAGSSGGYHAAYLLNGNWNMSTKYFPTERAAFQHILDMLYYGDE